MNSTDRFAWVKRCLFEAGEMNALLIIVRLIRNHIYIISGGAIYGSKL